jgi:hypothetical protein
MKPPAGPQGLALGCALPREVEQEKAQGHRQRDATISGFLNRVRMFELLDQCYTEFTPGQAKRSHDYWLAFRA